jgi:hypothetical protein
MERGPAQNLFEDALMLIREAAGVRLGLRVARQCLIRTLLDDGGC